MSNTPDNTTVPTLVPEANTPESVEKLSFVQKSRTFLKNHKKPAIAVGALVGLVGVAALTGRKTAPSNELYVLTFEPEDQVVVEEEAENIPLSQEN